MENIKQQIVQNYQSFIEKGYTPFAMIDDQDPYFIAIRYSGYIVAVEKDPQLNQESLDAKRFFEPLMCRFCVAIESQLKGNLTPF